MADACPPQRLDAVKNRSSVDDWGMSERAPEAAAHDVAASEGEQAFSCALTATLVARVHRVAGDTGVRRLLTEARSTRGVDYLVDIGNWVSMEETLALWRAGEIVTKDPNF